MSIDIGVLIVGESAPSGNINSDANYDDWVWLNHVTGEMRKFNPSTGQYDISIPVPSHNHEGLTGTRTIDGHTLTFTNGLLTGYQAP